MSTADGDVPVLGFRATRDLEPGETILCVRVRVRVRVRARVRARARVRVRGSSSARKWAR